MMKGSQQNWITRDKAVNWHPYTQMKTAHPIPIVRGDGIYLFDADGRRYLDMVSSWWVTLHGHAHPYIAAKVAEQLTTLEQVIFAGFTHPGAVELAERLLALLPENQHKVFYSDNGSTAVEVGLKMCVQYAHNTGKRKTKILALENGYHGDTFGAMSVSGRGKWTAPFCDMLFDVLFVDAPASENIEATKLLIERHKEELACFIYEPLVQGAGGMLMHEAKYLKELMEYCRDRGVLLIQDEVFVGFGRTGRLFAADHIGATPDIMCFSKGLTGGTMPLGITTCSDFIYNAFYNDDKQKALFHGHSFTASPLACAAALASLDLLLSPSTQQNIQQIVNQHHAFARYVDGHPKLQQVRQCGTILVLEWKTGHGSSYFSEISEFLYPFFLDRGILVRPLGNVLYLVPPFCISGEQLNYVYDQILEALDNS
ncbi:adenosylmethionine--8-amino-7-oxononanoate transaminase [Sphingobacterium suaedae]|uniref:Adenosylmethionine-8-amino-7-oxononanoate aminotransferase n=1 Tax=Sphingobacterium suaedae TaxID=1686402 RepID=A0ABW5KDM6_9SPHI